MSQDIDDLSVLRKKANENRVVLSDEERETLRKKVEAIFRRREKEERQRKLEEVEDFYAFGMYA